MAERFATAVAALTRVAQNRSVTQNARGIVLPLLSQLNPSEWTEFWSNFHGDQSRVHVIDIEDPDLRAILDSLPRDHVAVVKVGAVSQNIWNLLMSQSTYAPYGAGTTAKNFFTQLGTPYILSHYGTHLSADLNRHLNKTSVQLFQGDWDGLGDLLLKYQNRQSPESKLFSDYKIQFDQKSDKTVMSLLSASDEMCRLLLKTPPVAPKRVGVNTPNMSRKIASLDDRKNPVRLRRVRSPVTLLIGTRQLSAVLSRMAD
ncbi:MAG: hypothetical protein EOO38_20895 [Cytophagaceae bacterium]|nr:MAG: hypothetical protein EOO38_20895 [Cytophagaceae bacterium]